MVKVENNLVEMHLPRSFLPLGCMSSESHHLSLCCPHELRRVGLIRRGSKLCLSYRGTPDRGSMSLPSAGQFWIRHQVDCSGKYIAGVLIKACQRDIHQRPPTF
jgi:hypothetical protein